MDEKYADINNHLRDMIRHAPFPIGVYVGEDLRIALANDAMIVTYGKGEDVVGRSYMELLPELGGQQIFEQCLSVLRTGIPFHAKDQRVDIAIDGELRPFYFNYSFTPIYDATGAIYGVMNTGTDLTDLSLARHRLLESEEKLRMAITSANMGTYEISLVTHEIKTAGNFREIWGLEGEITQEGILAKVHPDDLAVRLAAHKQAEATGAMHYEIRAFRSKNDLRWLRLNAKLLYSKTGAPTSLLGTVQDITEEREFADQLKKQVKKRTRELKRSNEDLMQFANIMSHDLKEPVRKIRFFGGLLEHELPEAISEKAKSYLKKVQRSSERMASVIDGILHYATANKANQSVETLDLGRILEDIKSDLELLIHEKQAILVREDLPEMEGARMLIRQLFYNLVHNALKFSRPDNPPRVIISGSIAIREGVEYLRISVKDNGIGIDPAFSNKIFNAFERLHSKDEFEGTGLGLALCKKIVDRHRGHIDVYGEPGEGTEFVLFLPRVQKRKVL